MEPVSYLDIFLQSLRRSAPSRTLWLLSLILALPGALTELLIERVPLDTNAALLLLIEQHPLLFVNALFCTVILTLTGKSGLIVTLEKQRHSKQHGTETTPPSYSSAFIKALRIDSGFFLAFILIGIILALPLFFSLALGSGSEDTLFVLAGYTLIPILIIGYFLREFTYFYYLLSPLGLKSSFERSNDFFLRHVRYCIPFGILSFITTLLFTFFLNLVIMAIAVTTTVFPGHSGAFPLFVAVLFCLTWYGVFHQTLWFTFFQTLARPRTPQSQPETLSKVLKEEVPEMPNA
ncbi:MAG: hypothetical protein KBA91_02090 [Candidatus Moranbacteria bacterium]|nr:hypothetical protein [Candidatus Moranbacteria bacterium]